MTYVRLIKKINIKLVLRKLTYIDKFLTKFSAGRGCGKGSHVPFELLSVRLFGKNLIMIP